MMSTSKLGQPFGYISYRMNEEKKAQCIKIETQIKISKPLFKKLEEVNLHIVVL
jgi:hypothetical protein